MYHVSGNGDSAITPLQNDSVTNVRNRIYMVLGFSMVPFLLPFSFYSFIQGRFTLGVLTSLIVTLTVANALSIRLHRRLLINFSFLYVIILATLLWGITTLGPVVTYWCYPVAFVVIFVAEHRQARILIAVSMLLLIPYAFIWMDNEFAIRFSITYAMACYFGDLVISLLDKLQSQLTEQAITDPLTGAYNRRHMQNCLADAIEQHKRGLNIASIIALDIDHFKNINDSLGHEAGDKVLKNLVDILNKRKRKLDLVFRTGGEEFLILAQNISHEQSTAFAESLRNHIEESKLLDDRSLTVSLGVAHYQEAEDIDSWLRRADSNLYKAKQHGRNLVWPTPLEHAN